MGKTRLSRKRLNASGLTQTEFIQYNNLWLKEFGIPFRPIMGGGGSSKKKKAAESRAVDAQREAERAVAQTPQELQREQTVFEQEQLLRPLLERRATLEPEGLLRETGGITRQLMDLISRRLGMTGEDLIGESGPIGRETLGLATRAVSDPEKFFYSDVFQPNLALVEDLVNKSAARRGLFPSGIRMESLGRAGLDLAVQDALQKQRARVLGLTTGQEVTDYANQLSREARGEAGGVSDVARSESSGARGELFNFLQNLQSLREREKERAIGGTLTRTGTESQIHLNTAQREADAIKSMYGGLGSAAGAAIPLALAPFTGGASLAFLPMAASAGGSLAGGGGGGGGGFDSSLLNMLYSGGGTPRPQTYSPSSVESLLASRRGGRLSNISNYYPYGTS